MDTWQAAQLLVVALLAGTLAQVLAGLFRIPSILFLLVFGVVLGPEVLGVIHPETLGFGNERNVGLELLVRLGVAFILFEGGMALHLREMKKVQRSVRRLVTFGVLLTFVLATAAAHLLGGLPVKYAALFGSLVTVTGPTVIRPLVQRIKIRSEIAAILEGEGILADPVGAILAAVCLEYAISPDAGALEHLREFGFRMGVGIGVGVVIGFLAGVIVKYHAPSVERMKPLVVMACALGCYAIAETVRHEAGIMAVVAAGLAIQYGVSSSDRHLREFKELLTTVLLSVLFIVLAANLNVERMLSMVMLEEKGLFVVLAVMLVIRPLNIFVCTWGGTPTFREKIFLSWVAPRGIVAAGVASLGALILREKGIEVGKRVETLVFLTVFLTVFFQGGSAKFLASLLGITVKEARSVLILGGNSIARAVGHAYRKAGKKVTLIDRNPTLVNEAIQEGLRAISGDGTDPEVLHLAGLDTADIFVALTGRSTVNQMAAQQVLNERDMEYVWIALEASERTKLSPALKRAGAKLAFGRALPFDPWSRALWAKQARLQEVEITDRNVPKGPARDIPFVDGVVPLVVHRGARVEMVVDGTRFQAGDRVRFLVRDVDDAELQRTLGVAPPAEKKPS